MEFNEAVGIINKPVERLASCDPRWRSVSQKLFDAVATRTQHWKEKINYHRAQVRMLKIYADISPLLENDTPSAEGEVKRAFGEMSRVFADEFYIEIPYPDLLKADTRDPMRQLFRLNWPYCRYVDRKVRFQMPCCMASWRSMDMPAQYNELMHCLRRRRYERLAQIGPDDMADLTAVFTPQEELEVEIAIVREQGAHKEILEAFRRAGPEVRQIMLRQAQELLHTVQYRPTDRDRAISWFENTPGVWLLPLFDEHEFYRAAGLFYDLESDLPGRHDVFIIATSPGTIRPDEYYGPFYYTDVRNASPGGQFVWDFAKEGGNPQFANACRYIMEEMVGRPDVEVKSVNRPLYFDNGIGPAHSIDKVYLTTGATKSDIMRGPKRGSKDFWFRMGLERYGENKVRILLHTDDTEFDRGVHSLFEHFARPGRRVALRAPEDLFDGYKGIWYKYLTLTGKGHWVLSSRGTGGVREYISHGSLINLNRLMESADAYPGEYERVPGYLHFMFAKSWGMKIHEPADSLSPKEKLQKIFDEVYQNVSAVAKSAAEIDDLRPERL